jgi:DNA-binding MarR family transcriptional regulator
MPVPSQTPVPNRDVWRNILLVSGMFRLVAAQDDENREAFNRITVNQARILGYLFKNRAGTPPIRIKTLAHDLDVTPAAASQAVERLVAFGVIRRTTDPEDRRAVRLSFTSEGERLLERNERQATALLEDLSRGCTPEDFAVFCRVLDGIMHRLDDRWAAILAEKDAKKGRKPPSAPPQPL